MTAAAPAENAPPDRVKWFILAIVAAYAASFAGGWPQRWTAEAAGEHGADHEAPAGDAAGAAAKHDQPGAPPPYWTVIPFVLLLGAIAAFPLIGATEHWWESNLHRFYVAAGLGTVTLAYYTFMHGEAIESHWPAHRIVPPLQGVQTGFLATVLSNAILSEFIPFIVLLFSLYTIAGGIRITGDLAASPRTNATFMLVGGLLASLIGTTGAAMLLVRPLLETNRDRRHVAHTVIFFIFIVCNCGGCLLPIGDPPLFLGYLQGVAFTWTLNLWKEWAFVIGALLALYLMMDAAYYYRREEPSDIRRDVQRARRLSISGLGVNGLLLVGVVLAVALLDPTKAVPGTDWHPWMYLREVVQLLLVAASLLLGPAAPRRDNGFNYGAIIEVAALFIGIFICMQPALDILRANGTYLVERFEMGPPKFYYASGLLSSFLDNAPTYLVFFQTAKGAGEAVGPTAGVPELLLAAISLGSVFGGAMTYIGNGPNFMVKAIAEKSGVRMPSFFGYMGYSCLCLLPILVLNHFLFLE
ncbi:MAG TPA: sodium:proton antiporter [Lacipirellulaceae bacterium]|nr:sodium:proton antiporter [Lacipirellulaceae bacterium]